MSRLIKVLIGLAVAVLLMFLLSRVDSQKPMQRVEKPVNVDAAAK
jgi:hypothetical protein